MFDFWRFEFYFSPRFWAALVAAVLVVRAARARPGLRGWALLACSSALLLAIPRFGARDLALVYAVAGISFGVSRLLVRPAGAIADGRRRTLAVLGVGAMLGMLAVFKYHWLQEVLWVRRRTGDVAPSDYLFLIGLSYFSFKGIHVIVDSYKRTVVELDLLAYLNYILFFPSFISGPIARYPQFAPQLREDAGPRAAGDLGAGAERIVHGLFKKLVLVPIVFPYVVTHPARPLAQQSAGGVLLGLYAFGAYTYFDFSGYSDLAIGSARLLGFGLPENFNRPFLQKNIREFWTNWHMSLTSWLVDYVYWPLARWLRNLAYFRVRPVALSVVCMIATFLACGAWHGESWNFIAWGAYHGVGISAVIVYQRLKRKIRHPGVQRYFASRTSRVVGAIATAHYFTFGIALFALDLDKLRTVAAAVFH
jgi:alginate O-acetyltransferase complex protein AlgI